MWHLTLSKPQSFVNSCDDSKSSLDSAVNNLNISHGMRPDGEYERLVSRWGEVRLTADERILKVGAVFKQAGVFLLNYWLSTLMCYDNGEADGP